MTGEKDAPAEMPGEEERFAAAYLGFNPHDASTWDVDIVNRLVRIRSERGDQAFVQEVANLTTTGIHSPHNACCYREQCKAFEARALAAEAALAAERGRCASIADRYDQGPGDDSVMGPVMAGQVAVAQSIAAAIRSGEAP